MEQNQNKNDQQESPSRLKKIGIISVLSLALAIIIIDTTLLNVSIGYIIRDLNTNIQSLQWVITSYALTIAALTVTGGRLGDLFGRKRMFMLGAILFAIGSLIASFSNSINMLIFGESIVEGVGAALMMPATASLLVSTFKGQARAMAMGVWGGIAAAASAIGPILGGYLTTNYSWRWGFRINVFVAILLLIGSVIIKEYRDKEEKPTLDGIGVLLSSTGLFMLVFGIIESSSHGWIKAKEAFSIAGHAINLGNISIVLPSLVLAAILLLGFVLWELKVEKNGDTPIVSMKIFKNQQFRSGVITLGVLSLGQSGLIFSVPIFFQSVRNLDAYHTGLALLPTSLAALFAAPITALLSKKIPAKRLIQAGVLLNVIAIFVIRNQLTIDANPSDFIFGLIIYGVGMGMVMAQANNLIMSSVSVQEAGEASGVNNTFRQIGMSLGSAVIGAVLLTTLTTNMVNGINNSKNIPTGAKANIVQAVSSQTSNIEFSGGPKDLGSVSDSISSEITKISHQSTVDAAKASLIYTGLFVFLGFLVSLWLPNRKNLEVEESLAGKSKS